MCWASSSTNGTITTIKSDSVYKTFFVRGSWLFSYTLHHSCSIYLYEYESQTSGDRVQTRTFKAFWDSSIGVDSHLGSTVMELISVGLSKSLALNDVDQNKVAERFANSTTFLQIGNKNWRRFVKEVLLNLLHLEKWKGLVEQLKVGDIVLVILKAEVSRSTHQELTESKERRQYKLWVELICDLHPTWPGNITCREGRWYHSCKSNTRGSDTSTLYQTAAPDNVDNTERDK